VEASDDAIISKTLESRIVTWNAAAERIYRYSAREAIGRKVNFRFPPERLAEEAAIVAKISMGERVEHYETTRVCKGGRTIDVSVSVSPILDSNRKVVAASQISHDITEQKRAQTMVRESEAKLRAFLESASQGVVTIDQKGRIELVNAKMENISVTAATN